MTEDADLPAEVLLLWGLRDASRRGPKAALSVDDIVRAAVDVADTEGLAAVSMARVATELGNSTMALYRHVRSKDELLLLMADLPLLAPPDLAPGTPWRSGLETWANSLRDLFGVHPWLIQIPISGPPVGPGNLAWFDRGLGTLAGTGLSEVEKLGVVMSVLTFVHGEVRLSRDLVAGYSENPEAFGRQYGVALKRVVDPARLPALAAVLAAGVFDDETTMDEDIDTDYDFGLACLLDGIAGVIDRTSS